MVEAPFAAIYAQAGALGGLDRTGLAVRGEAWSTHGYLYIAPCDDLLPAFRAVGSACSKTLHHRQDEWQPTGMYSSHQARHSEPSIDLAWKLRDIKYRSAVAATSSVVRTDALQHICDQRVEDFIYRRGGALQLPHGWGC